MLKVTRNELNEKYKLDRNIWNRRHDDILDHLRDFMNIEERQTDTGRFYYVVDEDSLPEEIPPLPRKNNAQDKRIDYEEYTLRNMTREYQINTKVNIARGAIREFGREKYGHRSENAVAARYVGPVMDEKCQRSSDMFWVNSETYEIMDVEQVGIFFKFLRKHHITEQQAANAFYKQAQGEDISVELNSYKSALEEFYETCHYIPIKVYKWKIKPED